MAATTKTATTKTKNRTRSFPQRVAKSEKLRSGRTPIELTPIQVRTRGSRLDSQTRSHVGERMSRQFGKFALHIERAAVRFNDVNGPRGGVDQACDIQLVLSGRPSVVAEERGATAREAFDRAAAAAKRSLLRLLGRSGFSAPGNNRGRPRGSGAPPPIEQQAKRSTARRNLKLNTAGMTAALEDSETGRPSRKSTRDSANRAKRDSNLKRRQTRRVSSSKARARRFAAKHA